jgi:hypothetical protein
MKKSISVNKNPLGRPKKKGGVHPVTAVRLPPEMIRGVDDWASLQHDAPSRSESIRRLVELALVRSKAAGPPSTKTAERAKQLAAKTIDRLVDPAAHPEVAASRKRRLLKGPEEFREVRVDRQKKA